MNRRVATSSLLTCGPPRSDADQVRDTVPTVWRALSDGDGDEACADLTGNARRQLAGRYASLGARSCTGAADLVAGPLGDEDKEQHRHVRVGAVDLTGDRARVPDDQVTTADGGRSPYQNPAPMWLMEIDGVWKIDDLG